MMLNDRDLDLLSTLTMRVRLLAAAQVARLWKSGGATDRTDVRRRLRALAQFGLLDVRSVLAEPLLPMRCPLVTWKPGDAAPSFQAVAWRLRRRWTQSASETTVYLATDLAADTVGGVAARLPTLGQETHDLHVSEVYLRLRQTDRSMADHWIGEEIVRPTRIGEKLPDAMIVDPTGTPVRVVEFGGRYDAKRVAAFHQDCQARGIPYDLW